MADKPKTYAQQVQELKQQLEDAITDREAALRQASFVPELQDKISELNAQLAAVADKTRNTSVTDKAKMTDLIQRAESAEQGNRNAQAAYKKLLSDNEALQQQLDILGLERDKNRGKDDKIIQLSEELQRSNNRVAAIQQQNRDLQTSYNESVTVLEKQLRAEQTQRLKLEAANTEFAEKLTFKIKEIETLKVEFTDKLTVLWQQNQELKTKLTHYQSVVDNIQQAASGV